MGYINLNKYVSRHILFAYTIFLITGLIFFCKFTYIIKAEPDIVVLTDTVYVYIDSSKTHKMFLTDIGRFESNNDYRKVNRFGYLGKYQFGRSTLKEVKIVCTPQEFINQPMLQEHAMELYLQYNKKQLSDYIGMYQFTKFRGVYITESGILAAAHLGGAGSVKKFFKGGKVFKDGNGIPITTYMKEFSSYNLEFK
mgnify:CR=1 FL=1|jgi:hypothetical protein|tara:strand:+ start:2287 stop:2874 length:588 start_codon:yes stop_codon:yes gene_type:complete